MVAGEIVWKITGDDSGFNKANKKVKDGVKDTGKAIDQTTKKAEGMGTALKVGLAAAAVFAASKLKQFFSSAIDNASNAEETAQKFGNVFPVIDKKANAAAKSLTGLANISLSESKALLATSGNLLQSIGASEEVALSYGTEIAKMAADLKSFNNLTESTELVQQRLTKALLGEREALIGLDIKLSEKQLAGYAETLGITWKNATQLEKAETTMVALRDKSRLATDDVTKSAGNYEHVTRALANRQKDLSEDVGKEMLPAFTDLKKAFLDSSNDGGFLYNVFVLLGKAVGKVIQSVTLLVRALGVVFEATKAGAIGYKAFLEEGKNTGNTVKALTLLSSHGHNVAAAMETLRKEAAVGNKQSIKFLESLNKRTAESEEGVKKTKDAYSKLVEASQKLDGTFKEGAKNSVKGFQNISKSAGKAKDKIKGTKDEAEKFLDLDWDGKLGAINDAFGGIANNVTSLLGAIDSFYQAIADKDSERLEQQRNAALEAAGVAEEGTVQAAENALRIAQESGDESIIKEKEIELKRAKINDEFDKKKAELDYNANLRSWELQLAMAKIQLVQAPLSAYVSSLTAPWPLNMILPPINAALAAVTAGYGYAAVQQARPTKPKYEGGGFIGGNQRSGDLVDVRANAGESILNPEQQKNFMDIANGAGRGNQTIMVHNIIELDGAVLYENMNEASRDGKLQIAEGSIIKT